MMKALWGIQRKEVEEGKKKVKKELDDKGNKEYQRKEIESDWMKRFCYLLAIS